MSDRRVNALSAHHHPVRRSVFAAALAGVLAVGASACASADRPGAPGGGGSSSVTVAKAVDTIGFTTVDVADGKGYFKKEGVGVKEELLGGSSTAFAALQSGSVQFVTASSTALLKAKAQGVPLQAVAGLDYGVALQLIASNSAIKKRHLSPGQPLNTVMRNLSGSTLGVISATDLTFNHYLMQQAGVSQSKFKTISIKTQSAALAALQHGEIDAFLLSPPNSYLAQAQGTAKIIATLHSVPLLSHMAYDVLVTSTDYAKKHADTVRSVATAMAKADNVMAKDPDSVLSIEKKHYPSMNDAVLRQSLQNVTFTPDGKMTQPSWQDAKNEAASTGVTGASKVDVTSNGDTWTNSYIKSANL